MLKLSLSAVLLLFSASVHGFHASQPAHPGPPRPRSIVPPLFFTDIESEVGSITIPAAIHLNGTSVFVQSNEGESKVETGRRMRQRDKERRKPPQSHQVTWQKRYNELAAYKTREGHCMVPQKYGGNRKLGLWVMQQRRQYALKLDGKRSSLSGIVGEIRIRLLEKIGFVWRVERGGPQSTHGTSRRMRSHMDSVSEEGYGDEIYDAVDFERYMIQKSEVYSDKEKRAAWRRRYEMFQ